MRSMSAFASEHCVHFHVELAERHVAELVSKLRGTRPICVWVQPRLLEQACLDESLADLGPGVGNRAKSIAACRGHHVPEKALQHLSLSQRGTMLLNVVACLGAPGLSVAAYSLRAARSTEYFTFASTMGLPLAPSAGGANFCNLALGAAPVPTERLRFASLVGGTSGEGEGA